MRLTCTWGSVVGLFGGLRRASCGGVLGRSPHDDDLSTYDVVRRGRRRAGWLHKVGY